MATKTFFDLRTERNVTVPVDSNGRVILQFGDARWHSHPPQKPRAADNDRDQMLAPMTMDKLYSASRNPLSWQKMAVYDFLEAMKDNAAVSQSVRDYATLLFGRMSVIPQLLSVIIWNIPDAEMKEAKRRWERAGYAPSGSSPYDHFIRTLNRPEFDSLLGKFKALFANRGNNAPLSLLSLQQREILTDFARDDDFLSRDSTRLQQRDCQGNVFVPAYNGYQYAMGRRYTSKISEGVGTEDASYMRVIRRRLRDDPGFTGARDPVHTSGIYQNYYVCCGYGLDHPGCLIDTYSATTNRSVSYSIGKRSRFQPYPIIAAGLLAGQTLGAVALDVAGAWEASIVRGTAYLDDDFYQALHSSIVEIVALIKYNVGYLLAKIYRDGDNDANKWLRWADSSILNHLVHMYSLIEKYNAYRCANKHMSARRPIEWIRFFEQKLIRPEQAYVAQGKVYPGFVVQPDDTEEFLVPSRTTKNGLPESGTVFTPKILNGYTGVRPSEGLPPIVFPGPVAPPVLPPVVAKAPRKKGGGRVKRPAAKQAPVKIVPVPAPGPGFNLGLTEEEQFSVVLNAGPNMDVEKPYETFVRRLIALSNSQPDHRKQYLDELLRSVVVYENVQKSALEEDTPDLIIMLSIRLPYMSNATINEYRDLLQNDQEKTIFDTIVSRFRNPVSDEAEEAYRLAGIKGRLLDDVEQITADIVNDIKNVTDGNLVDYLNALVMRRGDLSLRLNLLRGPEMPYLGVRNQDRAFAATMIQALPRPEPDQIQKMQNILEELAEQKRSIDEFEESIRGMEVAAENASTLAEQDRINLLIPAEQLRLEAVRDLYNDTKRRWADEAAEREERRLRMLAPPVVPVVPAPVQPLQPEPALVQPVPVPVPDQPIEPVQPEPEIKVEPLSPVQPAPVPVPFEPAPAPFVPSPRQPELPVTEIEQSPETNMIQEGVLQDRVRRDLEECKSVLQSLGNKQEAKIGNVLLWVTDKRFNYDLLDTQCIYRIANVLLGKSMETSQNPNTGKFYPVEVPVQVEQIQRLSGLTRAQYEILFLGRGPNDPSMIPAFRSRVAQSNYLKRMSDRQTTQFSEGSFLVTEWKRTTMPLKADEEKNFNDLRQLLVPTEGREDVANNIAMAGIYWANFLILLLELTVPEKAIIDDANTLFNSFAPDSRFRRAFDSLADASRKQHFRFEEGNKIPDLVESEMIDAQVQDNAQKLARIGETLSQIENKSFYVIFQSTGKKNVIDTILLEKVNKNLLQPILDFIREMGGPSALWQRIPVETLEEMGITKTMRGPSEDQDEKDALTTGLDADVRGGRTAYVGDLSMQERIDLLHRWGELATILQMVKDGVDLQDVPDESVDYIVTGEYPEIITPTAVSSSLHAMAEWE